MVPLLLPLTRGQNGKKFPQETVRRRAQVYRYPGIGMHTPKKTLTRLPTTKHFQLESDIFASKTVSRRLTMVSTKLTMRYRPDPGRRTT